MKKLRQKAEKALLFLSYMIAVAFILFVFLLIAAGVNKILEIFFS